jgi:hypothetical protein
LFSLDDFTLMWQWLLRVVFMGLLQLLLLVIVAPLALLVATPLILLRAWFLAARKRQRFRFAVADAYDSVWHAVFLGFTWPLYSELDTLERIHRKSSNQTLQPTAGRSENYKGEIRK